MPRKLEIEALQAEAAGIRALLEEARSIDDPVGSMQFEQRLEEIKELMKRLRTAHAPMASVALFFAGKPVVGSVGIESDFAGRALRDYQELISKAFARSQLGRMGERGQVPLKQNATLMVTGLALGSFGFVLNELSDQTEIADTSLKESVAATSALLENVSAVNETSFEQAAEALDSRTLTALQKFFNDLDTEGATVRIVEDDRELKLDESAIHRARLRTEATEIEESPVEVEGILKGFMPDHRRFELQTLEGQTYSGSIKQEAAEQIQHIVDSGRPILGKLCKVGLIIRTLKSLNKLPRLTYRLVEFHSIRD